MHPAYRLRKYMGCSAQSVPSLSKVAMRSAAGTKSVEPALVTFSTKATMAFFDAVSFHDGNGSAAFARAAVDNLGGHPKPAIDGHLKTGHHE